VDIVERLRNLTGTPHSGNSAPLESGESVRRPVKPPSPWGTVMHAHASPPGTALDDGVGGVCLG